MPSILSNCLGLQDWRINFIFRKTGLWIAQNNLFIAIQDTKLAQKSVEKHKLFESLCLKILE